MLDLKDVSVLGAIHLQIECGDDNQDAVHKKSVDRRPEWIAREIENWGRCRVLAAGPLALKSTLGHLPSRCAHIQQTRLV